MANSTDPPGAPDFRPPTIKEAFGFQTDGEVPPSVKLGAQNAQQVVGQMQAVLRQGIIDRWADVAASGAELQGKIAHGIAQQVSQVQQAAAELKQPIAQDVVNRLGTVYEMALPLGVHLNEPGQEAIAPACVRIRQAAASGDLGPAMECYRSVAWPQRHTQGVDYTATVDFIRQSLPNDPAMQDAFATFVLNAQNEPDVVISQPATTPSQQQACIDQINQWVQRARDAAQQCYRQFPQAGPQLDVCLMNVIAAANANPPGCAQGMVSLDPGFNIVWAGGGGIPGGGVPGERFPPQPVPVGPPAGGPVPLPTPQPIVPGQPGQPPSGGPPPVVTPSPGGGGTPSGGGVPCDPAFIAEFFTTQAQLGLTIDNACQNYTAATGEPCYPHVAGTQCDTGYQYFKVNSNAASNIDGVCIKCGTTPPPCGNQTVGVPSCGTVVVQCCPTPAVPPVSGGGGGGPQPVPEVPAQANFAVQNLDIPGCTEFGPAPGIELPLGLNDMSRVLGIRNADGSLNVSWLGVDGIGPSAVLAKTLTGFVATIIDSLAKLASSVASQSGCASGQNLSLISTSLVLNLLRNFIGDSLDQFRVPNQQQRNYLCPNALPSADQAAKAWLSDTIDDGLLECWVRACGTRYPEFKRYVDANRSKLAALQYATLRMRDKIDQPTYEKRIRELGFTQPNDAQDTLDLLKQIPPPSDLVRMMVRDAADENLVERFHLDDQFNDKFKGEVEEWSRQQGIDPKYMQFLWRSHWSIPSPGQLAEMLHRLSRLNPGDPAYVDESTIRAALVQQDIAPFWVDKFTAISYRPLTRIDARRAYEIGALSDEELIEAYRNLGYSEENAQTLLQYNKVQAVLKFARSPVVKEYASGDITEEDLRNVLTANGARPEAIDYSILAAQLTMEKSRRHRCLTAYRRRFLLGDLDDAATEDALRSQGLDQKQIENLVAGWQCEKSARGKAIPAGELCGLYEQGAITVSDLTSRLQKIGYNYDDSVLLARRCAKRVADKISEAEQKAIRQQEREAERQQTKLQRQANQTARQLQRAAQNAERARKVLLAQTKRLQEAGVNFAKMSGMTLPASLDAVKAVLQSALDNTLSTKDEIIQALLVESRSPSADSVDSLSAAVLAALQA